MYQAIVFLPLLGAILAGLIALAGSATFASLLVAGEGLFTGVFTILITVYRPTWITTFDVRRYRLDRGPRV